MRSRAEVEEAATSLRQLCDQITAPIDPIAVAKHLGARVVMKDFSDDLSGVLVRKGPASTIAINAADGPLRKRYTVAHEVGHLWLNHNGEVFIDKQVINKRDQNSSLAVDNQEIEANQFAASLLMPRELVVAHLRDLGEVFDGRADLIARMATRFRVSKPAMEYRLINLGFLTPPDD